MSIYFCILKKKAEKEFPSGMSVLPTVEVPFLERCGTGSEVLKCIFMVLVNLASRI